MLNRRDLPQGWRNQVLEVNEMAFCHRGNLTAYKWKDNSDVCFLFMKHAASWTEVEVKAKGGKVKRVKPDCILDYNVKKIGVVLNDQYVSYYTVHRKSMKWWKKMFFHLLARSMVNAYIIYNKLNTNSCRTRFSHFLTRIVEVIAEDGANEEQQGLSSGQHVSGTSRLTGRHFLHKVPPSERKQVLTRARKVCAEIIKKETSETGRKETTYYCPDCNVPLCDLMMEPEGKHRNSIIKQRILAVFGLVEIVSRYTLTMNDFQGLMMQLEGLITELEVWKLHRQTLKVNRGQNPFQGHSNKSKYG
ncbi:PiggyBac transposable element-derived protein 4 [Eumeta japonica]|uniref:PiggyBac transposable element-derived protein 4 n=1 Tax=Eumeta variegata TaxID=151549 RepID=A0A4C1YC74_EUMVA|nr:PiggyBac transposable element-derived protein 4 [Eumeta japonica]